MNMTVARKMSVLVAIALVGLIGLSWFGQRNIDSVYEKTNLANVNSIPSIVVLSNAAESFGRLRVRIYRHVLVTDTTEMAKIENSIKDALDAVSNALKTYESEGLAADDKDKQMLAEDIAALNEYVPGMRKAMDFSRENKQEEARSMLIQNIGPAERATAAFKSHIQYNVDLAKKSADEAFTVKSNAKRISLIVEIIVLLATALMGWFITRGISRPLNIALTAANKISEGDLTTEIKATSTDETGQLLAAMMRMSETIKSLLAEMDHMASEHEKGDIDVVVDVKKFQGSYQTMAQNVNNMVAEHISVKKKAMAVFTAFGEGNFDAPMEQLPGKKVFINNTIELVRGNLKSVMADTDNLIGAAANGQLNTRADASKHQGDFRKMIQGINDIIANIVTPLNVAADYVDNISKGAIPAKITDNYNGDFNVIKNNLNTCIDAVNALVADANMLSVAAVEGRLQTRADANKHQGDFRKIVEGVNETLDGVILPVNEAVAVLTQMEQGDLTQTVNGDYKGQLKDFKDTVNNTIAKISQVISEVNGAAASIASASEEVSATAQSMSQATSEQAASVEETSASIEQMSASIDQNTENAKVTEGMATQASSEAVQGGEAVKETVSAMKSIAGKIGIIDDIAYQTNLLALNAAIEAARAGEHGRGFAVVAAEVRKLAERSQIAAQEIGELAESSVDMAESAGKLLDTIVPSIKKTSDLVQEISAASEEQSAGVSQINTAMDQLNQITQQNASSSEELAATSEEMSGQAAQLQELMAFFTVNDGESPVAVKSKVKAFKAVKKKVVAEYAPNEAEFVKF